MSAPDTALITRDRWGRPLIQPPGGGKPIPYTRISTLSSQLDQGFALTKWKQRMVALGLTRRADLLALVQTLTADDKDELDKICEQALVAADGERRANIGTAMHSVTLMADRGRLPEHLDPSLRGDAEAYLKAITDAGLIARAAERFVVNDELQAAGTFDRIYETADHRLVLGDIKTGDTAHTFGLRAVQVQTAVYARSRAYDSRGRGPTLEELGVAQDATLLIHLPAGQATCGIYLLDQNAGWADAQLAKTIHSTAASARRLTAQPYQRSNT